MVPYHSFTNTYKQSGEDVSKSVMNSETPFTAIQLDGMTRRQLERRNSV